jgi:hypothetical protein
VAAAESLPRSAHSAQGQEYQNDTQHEENDEECELKVKAYQVSEDSVYNIFLSDS